MEPSDRKARLSTEDSETSLLEVSARRSMDDPEELRLDEHGLRDADKLQRDAIDVMRSSSSEVLSESSL